MKKIILLLSILTSLTTMARFEDQYGANEIKIEEFKDGGSRKIFTTKDMSQIYEITIFPTDKKAESEFQSILDYIEKKNYQILKYTDVFLTKQITFLTTDKLVVISKTMDEVDQLVLDINTINKTDKFEQYLKLNDVHGSIGLKIVNAKMLYKMRDKK